MCKHILFTESLQHWISFPATWITFQDCLDTHNSFDCQHPLLLYPSLDNHLHHHVKHLNMSLLPSSYGIMFFTYTGLLFWWVVNLWTSTLPQTHICCWWDGWKKDWGRTKYNWMSHHTCKCNQDLLRQQTVQHQKEVCCLPICDRLIILKSLFPSFMLSAKVCQPNSISVSMIAHTPQSLL